MRRSHCPGALAGRSLAMTPTVERVLVSLGIVAYVLLASCQLSLPGLNDDEALDAVPGMQVVLGQRVDSFATIRAVGLDWPLMLMPYVGCTTTYLLMAAFAAFGVSLEVLRLANIALGIVALLLVWGFLRDLLDMRIATLSVWLLAVRPTFVYWTRMGAYVSLPLLPISIGTTWMLWRWRNDRRWFHLAIAGLLVGFGLTTKLLFVWYVGSLGIAWLLLSPWVGGGAGLRRWAWPWQQSGARVWIATAMMGLLGAAPLLIYNLRDLGTLRLLLRNLHQTELYGVNNLDLVANVRTVFLHDLRELLDGSWFANAIGELHADPAAVPALAASLGLLVVLAVRGKLRYSWRRLALLLTMMVAVVAQSAVTVSSLGANHLLIVWPVPQALVATAIVALADTLRPSAGTSSEHCSTPPERASAPHASGRSTVLPLQSESGTSLSGGRVGPLSRSAVCTIVLGLGLLASEVRSSVGYQGALSRTGGTGHYSDTIYSLASDLDAPDSLTPVLMDWGFRRSLQLLTKGRLDPEEAVAYTNQPGADYRGRLSRRVEQAPALYLFHDPRHTAFAGHWDVFEDVAYGQRLEPVLWKSYRQRDGQPVYHVYALEPAPRVFSVPTLSHPLQVRLGTDLALIGYELSSDGRRPGQAIQLVLYWQALRPPGERYKVFVHCVDSDGHLRSQVDSEPVYWAYPTDQWQAGEVVADRVRLQVPSDAQAGTYALFVGMYSQATGERLPAWSAGARLAADRVALTTFEVIP